MTMEDIDRIRELRFHEDPRVRKDRIELARMFGVTPLYVRLVAPSPEDNDPVRLPSNRNGGKSVNGKIAWKPKNDKEKRAMWIKGRDNRQGMENGKAPPV